MGEEIPFTEHQSDSMNEVVLWPLWIKVLKPGHTTILQGTTFAMSDTLCSISKMSCSNFITAWKVLPSQITSFSNFSFSNLGTKKMITKHSITRKLFSSFILFSQRSNSRASPKARTTNSTHSKMTITITFKNTCANYSFKKAVSNKK